jgi:D-3-phosphoglycerate dehydrogenase
MSKYRVLITDYAWPDLELEREILAAADVELLVSPAQDAATLSQLAADVDGILTCWAVISRQVIEAAGSLRGITRMGIGLDNIDLEECTRRGIPVTNVPDYCQQEVAEHTLALLLALARNIGIYHQQGRAGVYSRDNGPPLRRIEGATLGLVGLGRIGRQVAVLARAIGLRVIATRRDLSQLEANVELLPLDQLLAESDFLSLHLPLTDDTSQMIGAPQLALMKPGSFLVNTARGGLLDHQALAAALQSGQLAGAALDVQEPEPPPLDQPPYNHPHVIVTPHTAFVSEQSLFDLRSRSARQIVQCLEGDKPDNLVNPEVIPP